MTDRDQLYNDPEEAQRILLDGRQVQMWTAIPGYVTAVDFSTMTLEVQPTIQANIEDENGKLTLVNLPKLLDVPIVFPSAGGFTITMPIVVNDEVLVIFASRCIDAWFQSSGIQRPMESRMHDLSDGFAILGPKSLPNVIPNISSTDLQIRLNDGTAFISLKPNGDAHIMGNLIISGEVTANGIPLSTHLHGGVTSGTDQTGVPIP